MSLKLPGIGKTVKDFSYNIIMNPDSVDVMIDYQTEVRNGTISFNLRPDMRFETVEAIKNKVTEDLEMGHSRKRVEIREDKKRMYIYINIDQFTGNLT